MVLREQLPEAWTVFQTFTVRLGPRDRPEPDLTWFAPEEVRLVIEVESPESELRDREVKYAKYAEAGIEHYWRIGHDAEDWDLPEVHLYRLEQIGCYHEASIQRGRVMAHIPFLVDVDLTDLG